MAFVDRLLCYKKKKSVVLFNLYPSIFVYIFYIDVDSFTYWLLLHSFQHGDNSSCIYCPVVRFETPLSAVAIIRIPPATRS